MSTPLTRRFFFQQAAAGSFALLLPQSSHAASAAALPRAKAQDHGVNPQGILDFLAAVQAAKMELHSFMLLRHGQVLAEGWWHPYRADLVHSLYSMSKSFTSTAVGLAVAEGRLSVQDRVIAFFPKDLPAKVSDNLAAMRVKDLLTMSSGHEKEPTQVCVKSDNWVRTFLAQNIAHTPGSRFMYNSAATYMCSAIVQKLTGQTILDYLTPRLFAPMGISGMRWEVCPRGINTGGWGLSLQTEGLAKFGQLMLQQGRWQDQQLLPTSWVEEATRFHIQQPGGDKPDRPKSRNDWLQGYGYQFWRCQGGNAFRGDGAFGQFTVVLPEQQAVIAMTSETKNMQGQLDLVWQHLLPAFDAKNAKPADLSALHGLKLPLPAGGAAPAIAWQRRFALEPNAFGLNSLSLESSADGLLLNLDQHRIACGLKDWKFGQSRLPILPPRLISGGKPKPGTSFLLAAHATWSDPQTLLLTLRYPETPHSDSMRLQFTQDGQALSLELRDSLTAMNPKARDPRPALKGRAA